MYELELTKTQMTMPEPKMPMYVLQKTLCIVACGWERYSLINFSHSQLELAAALTEKLRNALQGGTTARRHDGYGRETLPHLCLSAESGPSYIICNVIQYIT